MALVLSVGCSRDPNVRKQKYLQSGKQYEDAGKYKEATIQFSNALKVDKNYADAHYELAKTYLKMGNAMQGYSQLRAAVELAPTNLAARIDLGNVYLSARAWDRAENEAKTVLATNPNYADAYALLAGVAQGRGNTAAAIENINRALAIDPNKSNYHTASALLKAGTPGNEVAAEEELRKAASLDAKSPTPHVVLAGLLERKGDVAGAEQQYLTAVNIKPEDLQLRTALAGLYFRQGNKEKAEQTLRDFLDKQPDNQQAAQMLSDYYARTGQMDRATSTFADLSSKHPKSFSLKLTYARLLTDKKDFAKANQVAAELTKSDGGNPEVQVLNAVLLLNTGKVNEALALLQKATKDSPNNIQTQLLLGRVAAAKGDTATAETSYRAAAKLNPGSLEAQSGLADVAVRRNDGSMLQDIGDRVVQSHPEAVQGYLWRGSAEGSRKEYDKAEADYQHALKVSPNNPDVYVELGQLRLAEGKVPEGKVMLEKALEINPGAIRALGLLVEYDMQAKQPAKAAARVQTALAKEPNNGLLYAELAKIELATRDFQGAAQNGQKAMQLAPNYVDAYQTYTQAEVALGNIDPVIATWERWLASHPGDNHAEEILGTLEESKGDVPKAKEYYKKALQVDANDPVAANNLAYIMVESGDNVDVALSLAQTARRGMPNSAQTADTLAWTYFKKGNYSEARDLLEDALKTAPNDPSMHFHLGMTYSMMNNKQDAMAHLKKAASIDPNGRSGKDAAAELAKMG
ncbi:MAG: tetratricopeptide repeat protein [Acidobacteriota bacterium]|nr:tetratricopeptide repeat protein [Acidobacteriota bacterium]